MGCGTSKSSTAIPKAANGTSKPPQPRKNGFIKPDAPKSSEPEMEYTEKPVSKDALPSDSTPEKPIEPKVDNSSLSTASETAGTNDIPRKELPAINDKRMQEKNKRKDSMANLKLPDIRAK